MTDRPKPCGRCKVLRDELHLIADQRDDLREAVRQLEYLLSRASSMTHVATEGLRIIRGVLDEGGEQR